jgi:hypothetical protein
MKRGLNGGTSRQSPLPPLPDVVAEQSGGAWFEIERIVRHHPRGAISHEEATHYVVKWVGYPSWENTKEPARRVAKDCREAVTTYWHKRGRDIQALLRHGTLEAWHERYI